MITWQGGTLVSLFLYVVWLNDSLICLESGRLFILIRIFSVFSQDFMKAYGERPKKL